MSVYEDRYVYAGDYQWAMNKVYDLFDETWKNGYDNGQSFAQSQVIGYLRTIYKLYGGIQMDEHLQSIILEGDDEFESFVALEEFVWELEKAEKEKPMLIPKYILYKTTVEDLFYYKLEDNGMSEDGGTAFEGETLGEFAETCDLYAPIIVINEKLKECGIKELTPYDVAKYLQSKGEQR